MSTEAPIVQPPLGLENFSAGLKQGINTQLELKRQQELEKISESLRMSARIAELRAAEQQRINELEARDRKAAEEGTRILDSLRVAERLRYIQDAVWEGRGQIRAIERVRCLYDGINKSLSTLELNYQFPALSVAQRYEADYSELGQGVSSYWQFSPATASTSLLVEVIDIGVRRGTPDLNVRVFSEVKLEGATGNESPDRTDIYKTLIPVGTKTTEKELEAALMQETVVRVNRNFIPPRQEEFEKEALKKARRSPGWQKWVSGDYSASGQYYHERIGYRK